MKNFYMTVMLLMLGGMSMGVTYAASDACCGKPDCFCFKAENGDWLKGTSIAIPRNAQTKGEQFRARDQTPAPMLNNGANQPDLLPGAPVNTSRSNKKLPN